MPIIDAIDVYRYTLSYAHGEYEMSGGRAAKFQESTLVRITTQEGITGWGEVSTLAGTYWPAFAGGARAALFELSPHLIGIDASNLRRVHEVMDGVLMGHAYAKSAIDIACWDVLGKAAGLPIAELLGGRVQQDFALYEAVPLAAPEVMAEFIRAREAVGITAFQVKVGNDPLDDASRLRASVQAASSEALLIADANGGWNLQSAVRAVREINELPIYLEQPCASLDDCAQVRRLTTLPMVLDECVLSPRDVITAKQTAGAGSVNLKLGRLGGLTGARIMRDVAISEHMTLSLEDAWGGDVATAAVSHLAASTSAEALLSVSFFNDWTNEHVAGYLPRSQHGRGSAPIAPGLGIEVEVGQLDEHLFTIDRRP